MDLSVSIVNWNTCEFLDPCLDSIFSTTTGIEFEVVVVDNASSDHSAEMLERKFPQARLIRNSENVGFARANNQAYGDSSGKYFLLLNPDTLCRPDSLARLTRFLDDHSRAGAVGPLVLNSDETLQHSWARFPTLWSEARGKPNCRIEPSGFRPSTAGDTRTLGPFEADWIGGCCLLVRRSAVEQIGLMDESLFMYSEETDWCFRLRMAGWEVWVEPEAEIIHIGSRSSDQASEECREHLIRSKVAFFSKHHGACRAQILNAVLRMKRRARKAFPRRNPLGGQR